MSHRNRFRDETGSMMMALLATIVVGGLVVSFLAMVATSQRVTRHDRDFQQAIHVSEAHMQEALTKIGHDDEDGSEPVGTTLCAPDSTCPSDGSDRHYEAEKIDPNTWQATSWGRVGGSTRKLEAVISRTPTFPVGAFGDKGVDLTGSVTVASYNSNTQTWKADCNNDGIDDYGTCNGTISTNHKVKADSGSSCADVINLNGPHASVDNTVYRCDFDENPDSTQPAVQNGAADAATNSLEVVKAGIQECDASGEWQKIWRASDHGGTLNGDGDGLDNNRLCVNDLEFDEDTTASEKTRIYVTGKVSVGKHVEVNCDGCNGDGLGDDSPLPSAQNVQIYSDGPHFGVGNHSKVAAVIYAPKANCGGSPSNAQAAVYGAMVCNHLQNQGGWSFYFDDQLLVESVTDYDIETLREEVGGTSSF